jgi:hypothetical protein
MRFRVAAAGITHLALTTRGCVFALDRLHRLPEPKELSTVVADRICIDEREEGLRHECGLLHSGDINETLCVVWGQVLILPKLWRPRRE